MCIIILCALNISSTLYLLNSYKIQLKHRNAVFFGMYRYTRNSQYIQNYTAANKLCIHYVYTVHFQCNRFSMFSNDADGRCVNKTLFKFGGVKL